MEPGIPIVSTKLQPPVVRADILHRSRLLDPLALVGRSRATLLCAGAGYGKTTLLSAMATAHTPVVWYSLGPSDRDLAVFTSYLVYGIRMHEPGFGERVLRLLSDKAGSSVDSEIIAGELINGLSKISGKDIIIILDDLHFVDGNKEILKVVDYLLIHLPSNAHLVIATRRAPRLPSLPRLRMIGEINDITEVDLRFTDEEAHELFTQVYGTRLSSEAVSIVAEQTEGWIIGLQLAAQSLTVNHLKNPGDLLSSLGANKKRLFEYLAEEVLKRQPANVQRFLSESSVLANFSSVDCDQVLGRTDSGPMLEYLEQNNLFVVEVADGFFRYHHLFCDFLRQQTKKEPSRFADLQKRAGAHFERRGDFIQAVYHYLAGEFFDDAARLVIEAAPAMLRASGFDTLTYWISQLPDTLLYEQPNLLILQAQAAELQGDYDLAQEWLERASSAFAAKHDSAGISKVLRTKAFLAAWRLDRQVEVKSLYNEALDHLNPEDKLERADLLRCIAWSDLADGNPGTAFEHYERALALYEELGDKEGLLAALITPGMHLYHFGGDFAEALISLRRAQALALELGSQYRLAECLGCLAVTFRFMNRSAEARECATKAVALSREIGAVQLEARNLDYLGISLLGGPAPDLDFANSCFDESARLGESLGNGVVRISSLMWKLVTLRRMREWDELVSLGNALLDIAEKSPHRWLLPTVEMVVGSVLIYEDAARAETLLLKALQGFQRFQDKWSLTVVNFWLALLYSLQNPEKALEPFKESLDFARANGYDFWFLEEWETAEYLLSLSVQSGVEPEYCMNLLKLAPRDNALQDLSHQDVSHIEVTNHGGEPNARLREVSPSRSANGSPRGASATVGDRMPGDREAIEAKTHTELVLDPGAREHKPYTPEDKAQPVEEGSTIQIPPIRIWCFGNFRVQVGDRLIGEDEWQRKDVKSLLKYLATAPDHKVLREQVAEIFWGGLSPEGAKTRLWKALYFLRRVLEPETKTYHSQYIVSRQGLLLLHHQKIEMLIDVDEFMRHIDAGQVAERLGDIDHALREYEAAVSFYIGELFADDPYEDWAISKRERFANLYVVALEKLARWSLDRADYALAATYLQKLLAEDSYREDIYVMLMRCLARMGRRHEALAQYTLCRRTLKKDLRLEPTSETQELFAKLTAGEAI